MHLDVIDMRDFYTRPLGRVARRLIGRQVRAVWPNVKGMTVAGFGYATPYLRPFLGEAERVLGLMPAQQGVTAWPSEGPGLTALVSETSFPLPDESVDRLLLVHSVENSEALGALLRQVWRVLAPGGRVLIVAPNRAGIWARREKTPFGHGRPFTRGQLTQLLRGALFSPTSWTACLFVPPFGLRSFLRSAVAWERMGEFLGQRFAGVILVEASKQIYAIPPLGQPVKARRLRIPAPAHRSSRVTDGTSSGTLAHDARPSEPE